MAKFDIAQHIEFVGRELVSSIENARELGPDSNAKGAAIESATRKKLEELLPSVLGVGQGYIIDSYGNISRQIDLVIFERNLCPFFSIGDSPESTCYPCEGVLAAIEIKSTLGKKEFEDSCKKANSVRQLQRRYGTVINEYGRGTDRFGEQIISGFGGMLSGIGYPEEGVAEPFIVTRKYGQIEQAGIVSKLYPKRSHLGDLLTGIIAGQISVGQDTFNSYYNQAQRNAPDFLISLDGVCGEFVGESNNLTSARLAARYDTYKIEKPFSRLIAMLYSWAFNGKTAPFETFFNYFQNEYKG